MPRPVALTGTPGTGKSSVAARLASRWTALEVGALAVERRAARGRAGALEVDLRRLRRSVAAPRGWEGVEIVVGHLAHLLPVRDVIVLRCHPIELERRLRVARRGTPLERHENFVAEATDLVLQEAIGLRRRVWEVDTSGRPLGSVARDVAERLRHRGPSSFGTVDWLADPRVTAHLLDPPR